MFCLLLNAELLLVPDYHMMDMNIISLVTISLLMVSVYRELRETQWRRVATLVVPAGRAQNQAPTAEILRCWLRTPLSPEESPTTVSKTKVAHMWMEPIQRTT